MVRCQTRAWAAGLLVAASIFAGCLNGTEAPEDDRDLAAAEALVWDEPYPNLHVDIDYVPHPTEPGERQPARIALEALKNSLENETRKQEIRIDAPEPLEVSDAGEDREWDFGEVTELETQSRDRDLALYTEHGTNETAFLHVLYLNGDGVFQSSDGSERRVSGVAAGHMAVVFPDGFDDCVVVLCSEDLNPTPEPIERTILIHELGHVLGLVNQEAPMLEPRLYGDGCRCHSNESESPMWGNFHPYEAAILEYAQDNEWWPYRFDQYDKADLQALRDLQPSAPTS